MKALSIRQPWAWLIANGHKDIENRCWKTYLRGRFLIHASKGMTRDDYATASVMAEEQGIELPSFGDLERGGIIGEATITDCVTQDASPWFFGEYGFVIKDARPLPFAPCKGALGFFTPAAAPLP
jgi:hypothetical protein